MDAICYRALLYIDSHRIRRHTIHHQLQRKRTHADQRSIDERIDLVEASIGALRACVRHLQGYAPERYRYP